MIKINVLVSNENWKKLIKNPDQYLKKKLNKLNKKEVFFKKRKIEFSLLLSGNKEIKKINYKFRKKNKVTDVLSFPFYNTKILKKLLNKNKLFYLGDIIINLDKIYPLYKNLEFKKNFDKLWLHGFLHLLGERHKLNKDYIKMVNLEKKFFKYLN
tara:strand:+ start:856 stop:1320 length:465 start_codon:yes stop_codon:yes gene_type:complete